MSGSIRTEVTHIGERPGGDIEEMNLHGEGSFDDPPSRTAELPYRIFVYRKSLSFECNDISPFGNHIAEQNGRRN
jgi:hypothetical protein